ncbi:MAG: DUF2975 domain-containing protein [Candidatus Pacebacteria bacterium]|nr:DUF2975 domain-containing protein [Candidatus Paceibacterota bacterium]
MKKFSTIVLQVAVVAFGSIVLALMLWEPQNEGRNVNATQFQIYFNDPFLAYAYASSIAYFVGVYQAFRLLGYVRSDQIPAAARAARIIKRCATALVALIAAPIALLFVVRPPEEDIAGGVAMGLFFILMSVFVAIGAGIFEKKLQKGS